MRTRKARLATAFALLALLVGAAFLIEYLTISEGGSSYRLVVTRDGELLRRFGSQDLLALEARQVTMQGKPEEGPPLLTLLDAAGVDARDFDSVIVIGAGVRDSGRLVLSAKQIDLDVLLDIANRGTTKICGPEIERVDRVRDVTEIQVR